MDAVRMLEGELRELVRRQGVDPQREGERVRALIDEATADYEARSLVSSLPRLEDPEGASQELFDRIAGLGPLQRLHVMWTRSTGLRLAAGHGSSLVHLQGTSPNRRRVRDE